MTRSTNTSSNNQPLPCHEACSRTITTEKDLERAIAAYLEHLDSRGSEDKDDAFVESIADAALLWLKGPKIFDEITRLMNVRDGIA